MEPVSMSVSSYLLRTPRSLEQVIADLGRDKFDSSSLRHDNNNNAPDADQDAEATAASAS
jgi:hypothetical protein